jgi:hypothetical protein
MGGDNSVFEFSGWQKAIQSKEAVAFSPDVYLFANDAFLVKGFYSMPVINDDILEIVAREEVFGGNLRRADHGMKYQGATLDRYITTHFFAVSSGIIKKLGSVISETSVEKFLKPEYSGEIFAENEIWTPRLKKDLLFSLTHKYHEKGRKLSPEQYDFFKRKVICIVNEILLSARVGGMGYKLVNLAPFPEILNSGLTIYTPFTTIRPFQLMRKMLLSVAFFLFCNDLSRRLGLDGWFEKFYSARLKKGLLRQV